MHLCKLPCCISLSFLAYAVDQNDPGTNIRQAVDAGFNVVLLAFYLTSGAVDAALAWANVSPSSRAATIAYAHARGAVVMLSLGGATGTTDCSGQPLGAVIRGVSEWVQLRALASS